MKVTAAILLIEHIANAVRGAIEAGRDDIPESEIDAKLTEVRQSGDDLQDAIDRARGGGDA